MSNCNMYVYCMFYVCIDLEVNVSVYWEKILDIYVYLFVENVKLLRIYCL